MKLNRLCIILPADLDEIAPYDHPQVPPPSPAKEKVRKHHHRGGCGSQVLTFFGDFLRRLYDSKWVGCCQPERPRKQESGAFHDLDGIQISEKVGGDNPRIFSYAELFIGSNGFSEDEILGSGGFGKVYRAVLPSDGTVVAVKCLAEKGEQFEKTFEAELVAVAHLRHRNLVRLRGWCVHEDQLLLVYDYMPNRSLDRMPSMRNNRFRLAESTRIGGTIGYLPPESFQKKSVATAKSDVFSFGIVVLEVVSGRRAVDLTYSDDQIILLDWIRRLYDMGKPFQAGDSRLPDGSYSLSDMERLIHLGLLCTLHNPQLRPNMKWIVEILSGNISGNLPPLPSFQSHPRYVSLSSPSNTSTSNTTARSTTSTPSSNTTVTSTTSTFVTAIGETIYATAELGNNDLSSSNNRSHRQSKHFMVETPREISYKEIISATNNFADSHRVAEVDFGTAYQGILDDGHQVLVKRLGMTKCPAIRTRFSSELQNLAKLRHRNLIQLRGWCTEQGELLVVYDYSANRLLSHLLFHHDNRVGHSILQWHHRYNIVKSLASAILYLHEEWDEQVIHRNITSSSVILDPDMNPRLEYIESGEATPMADVYSFGVVVLEVVTGQMAVDFRRPEVLVVNRVHEFEAQKRPLEDLVDIRLNCVRS
ncbi:hypothetical protein GH714_022541 [Hevea brasiliensis]|uniref:Protein kinase domain-containing protein n=1 Tax=Hevea brasiliensis TaxID=3981 RepID=A0A6A6KIW7_HEVBR|nr:hypothetical protein GH714_022541 [Hevea brasiliensis]